MTSWYILEPRRSILPMSKVLYRLLENELFVNAKKCDFHCSTTSCLGYIISAGSIRMDPKNVTAVVEWPPPENCWLKIAEWVDRPDLQHSLEPPSVAAWRAEALRGAQSLEELQLFMRC
ncbi:hypothetical protein COCON_G00049460 [Conger conger]|uniref:Uncharacterized protein n=1 Tax=Conger conger TaxID=82655 RepID=A0A9Q1DV61_CONCO|nr:hypothetical protein COCON_G00049460 [Conger conger]